MLHQDCRGGCDLMAMKNSGKFLFAIALGAMAGCAGHVPGGEGTSGTSQNGGGTDQKAAQQPDTKGRHFEEPGELDKLLDNKPIALAAVKPASQSAPATASSAPTKAVSKGNGSFRIQVGAESDVDAAQ